MKFHVCRVKHEPTNGTYGDCVRACVASWLGVPEPLSVPHFYEDNCDGEEGLRRMTAYLKPLGLLPFVVAYPGELPWQEVIQAVGTANAEVPWLFFHGTESGGDHVVLCVGEKLVHDPAWYKSPIKGPNSSGVYFVMVLVTT